MVDQAPTPWARSRQDRWVAGVCGVFARRLGGTQRLWRGLFLLATLGGIALALAFAIFDSAVLGHPAPPGLREAMIGTGLVLASAYCLLALFLPEERRPRTWDFAGSLALVLLLVLAGQALGVLLEPYWQSAKSAWLERGASGWFTFPRDHVEQHGFGLRDVVLGCFFLSAGGYVWTMRAGVKRFFRSMHAGVTLVSLTLLSVALGVLVPQIDGFEDPAERVDLEREHADYLQFKEQGYQKLPTSLLDGHEQYEAFRWAEGYFVYHLLHPYGIGMPAAVIPPQAAAGLEAFGTKYGIEERDNRSKQMKAAFQGQEKVQEIGQLIHEHEDTFWRFFEVSSLLHLNRTYKSHWFASLLFLLATAITFNTFKGSLSTLLSLRKAGFVIVHLGMLVLLAGGLTSKLFTDRGILELNLDAPPEDTYYRHFDPRKLARMPFHLRLDRFARRDWPALEVVFFDEEFTSRVPRYTLWPERKIELDYAPDEDGRMRPQLALRVLALHDRANVGLPFVAEAQAPQDGSGPVVEVAVSDSHLAEDHVHLEGDDHTRRTYLFPLDRGRFPYTDPGGAYRVGAVYGGEAASWFPGEDGVATVGTLEATTLGADASPESVRVRLGEEVQLSTGYRLRFIGATADIRKEYVSKEGSTDPRPLEEQPDGMAAVWVDVIPANGGAPERRILLEDIDDVEHGRQREYAYPELVLRLAWDDWLAPGPPRYVLRWEADEEPSLWSESGEHWPVAVGEPLPLPGANPMVPRQFLTNAEFEKNVTFPVPEPRDDGWDADFYAREPRGLELEVTRFPGTSRESAEHVVMATSEAAQSHLWFAGDERLALVFLENTEMLPFEWRSVLTVLEKDAGGTLREVQLGPEEKREIRVNDYFQYKGYRFFQTNARPEDPSYSGIGVVYDPGIPIVLAGMYTVIAGMVVAFLVRPIRLGWDKVAKA